MARLPYPDPSEMSPAVRRSYDAFPKKLNIVRMMAHLGECYTPLFQLGGAILTKQKLSPRLRELAILRVAKATGAGYEWTQHAPIAIACGATDEQVEALERGDVVADCFGAGERNVLAFCDELIDHTRPDDETLAAVSSFLSHQEVLELTLTVGFYQLMAQLMETSGIESEPSGGDETIRMLREGGLS